MSRIIISLGWIGVAAGILYFIFQDRRSSPGEAQVYIDMTRQIFFISGAILAGGYLLKFLGQVLGIGRYSRCQKCKKRIDKGEMFCFDHRREKIWNAQERHRSDGGVVRQRTKH